MNSNLADSVMPNNAAFATRLARNIKGEVLFDRASRGRYSTDASIYQMEPVGVIVPETIDDVVAAMAIARDEGIPVLARGGGTSQCGQTVNRALVIDCSKHLRRILHVDAEAQTALVEPGLVLGHLNNALRSEKLFFPVDPSTHARCTIGGMAGNNSCGSKSIRYGLMADNVRAIEAILSDGSQHRFGITPDNLGERMPATIADLIQRLRALGISEADEIAARFPKQLRRVGGYNIDVLTPAARAVRPRQSGPPAGRVGGHAGILGRDRTDLASGQAAQGAGHLPVPDISALRWKRPGTSSRWTRRRSNWSIAP